MSHGIEEDARTRAHGASPLDASRGAATAAPPPPLRDPLDALPPLKSACPEDVEARFAAYWAATCAGSSFTAALRSKPAFLNPYALEEALAAFGIDDRGTAFPPSVWDPHGLPPGDHYDGLAIRQQMDEEARRVRQAARTEVAFVRERGAAAGGGGACGGR